MSSAKPLPQGGKTKKGRFTKKRPSRSEADSNVANLFARSRGYHNSEVLPSLTQLSPQPCSPGEQCVRRCLCLQCLRSKNCEMRRVGCLQQNPTHLAVSGSCPILQTKKDVSRRNVHRGLKRIRTAVYGFADRCLATRPSDPIILSPFGDAKIEIFFECCKQKSKICA